MHKNKHKLKNNRIYGFSFGVEQTEKRFNTIICSKVVDKLRISTVPCNRWSCPPTRSTTLVMTFL